MVGGKQHGRWTFWNNEGEVIPAWSGVYENGQRVSD